MFAKLSYETAGASPSDFAKLIKSDFDRWGPIPISGIRLETDPNILRDKITTIDNALTKPWIITRSYSRATEPEPLWVETTCGEDHNYLFIEGQTYLIGADGKLMPSGRGQQPPDLRHFEAPK